MFLFNPNNLLFIWTYVNDCFNMFFFFYSFTSALTYYGICFSVGSFGVNIYLAQFFSGLSEAPSLLLPFLLKRWGRRPFCMGLLFLSGISCMLSLLVSKFCSERHGVIEIQYTSTDWTWSDIAWCLLCLFEDYHSWWFAIISLSEQTSLPLLWLWHWWASCVCSPPTVSLCSMGSSCSQL